MSLPASSDNDLPHLAKLTVTLVRLQDDLDSLKPVSVLNSTKHHTTKEVLSLLKKRPLKILLDGPPDDPLLQFVHKAACKGIVSAFFSFGIIAELVLKGLTKLWVFDAPEIVWASVFRWIEYLQPTMLNAVDAMASVLEQFACLPADTSRSIILSGGYDAVRDIVTIWLHWPRLLGSLQVRNNVARMLRCTALLQALWRVLNDHEDTQAVLVAELLRASRGDGQRLFRTLASHINLIVAREDEITGWLNLERLVWTVAALTSFPELRERGFPRKMVRAAMSAMHLALVQFQEAFVSAQELIAQMSRYDREALLIALQHGLFPMLVRHHRIHPNSDTNLIHSLICCALVLPAAVRRLYRSLKDVDQDTMYHRDDQALCHVAQQRHALLQRADDDWKMIATCSNAICTTSASTALHACVCGEALYCSRVCQRMHWKVGQHRTECLLSPQVNDGQAAPLRARDLHFLVVIARAWLEENFVRLSEEYAGSFLVKLDLSSVVLNHEVCAMPSTSTESTRVVTVQAMYQESGSARSRRIMFDPEWKRRQVRFRLLTDAHFDPMAGASSSSS